MLALEKASPVMRHINKWIRSRSSRRAFLALSGTLAFSALCRAASPNPGSQAEPVFPKRPGATHPADLIRIGILLGTFSHGTLDERLDAVKAAGLDYVQLSMDCAGLSALPDQIPASVAKQIREAAAQRGITLASVQGTFNMCHPDPEQRRWSFGDCGSLLRLAPS